jgi:hypothetical protein
MIGKNSPPNVSAVDPDLTPEHGLYHRARRERVACIGE